MAKIESIEWVINSKYKREYWKIPRWYHLQMVIFPSPCTYPNKIGKYICLITYNTTENILQYLKAIVLCPFVTSLLSLLLPVSPTVLEWCS